MIPARTALLLMIGFMILAGADAAPGSYRWRGIEVHNSTPEDAKKALGTPTQEYREQLLYENQVFDPADANGQHIRLNTVVLNIGVKGVIESIFISPEWGTTDQDVRAFFGKGKKTTYKRFLSTMGEIKVGAGTRPNEKLHYVDLDSPCEVFPQSRVLMLYHRQDVVSGNYLLQFILFY
ncbi:MAG: hypothetical protein HY695_02015 [Deltaproteobacteria bacterium]|nr:hypothetical protein [Deltaproteobacteria bacterium]